MAAGRLEVEVTANTTQLEAGLQNATDKVNGAASNMAQAGEASAGFADKAIKTLAMVGAVEAGVKGVHLAFEGISGIFAALQGDAEGLDDALNKMSEVAKQLPFGLGAIASAIEGLAASIMGVDKAVREAAEAQERLAKITRQVDAAKKYNAELADGNRTLRDRLGLLQSEDQFALKHNQLTQERFRLEEELQELMAKASEESGVRNPLVQEEIVERMRLIDEIIEKEKQLNIIAGDKARAEAKAAAEAERQLKAKQLQEKLERERLAREKELQRLQEERERAQKELADAQRKASEGLSGATGSVSTVAGAFTVGIDAQLNETKLMRSVTEKSRDILKQIAETLEKRERQPLLM